MPPAPSQSGQPESSSGILWVIAAIFIAGAGIWYVFKAQLASFYLKLKLLEIDLIQLFTHNLDDVRTVILTTDPGKFTFEEVVKVGDAVGNYLRFPLVAIVMLLA